MERKKKLEPTTSRKHIGLITYWFLQGSAILMHQFASWTSMKWRFKCQKNPVKSGFKAYPGIFTTLKYVANPKQKILLKQSKMSIMVRWNV